MKSPSPSAIEHWLPEGATLAPVQLSIVIPALNERITVGEFVDWCHEGIRRTGVSAQILIVDSSTDETPRLALERGAEVLRTPRRGLGRAYIDALPYIRGEWVILGDADLTYDFRELGPFLEKFREGYDMVMGSRFLGSIEPGAMPPLHRYFGTPLTTWIFNLVYGTHFSDIHCGIRGMTRAALLRIDLRSQSWEYASEMILKSSRMGMRVAEVPVRFYKDREGRLSHLRRGGWRSPWIAGWLNLRVIFVYSPDSFMYKPGLAIMALGIAVCGALSFGPIPVGPIQLNVYSMLFGLVGAVLGYACVQLGVLARIVHGLRPGSTRVWQSALSYDRGMAISALAVLAGIGMILPLLREYFADRFHLWHMSHVAITGLMMIVLGFQTFIFTLLLEMLHRVQPARPD
jgi:glycosyltransferase involved in cell wall biosynthesis